MSIHALKDTMTKKIGIAGLGAMGRTVAKALQDGIPGLELIAAADINPPPGIDIPILSFTDLARACDLIVECLPAAIVPELTKEIFNNNKDLIIISSAALLIHPEILEQQRRSQSRIYVPSGALAGLDGVRALMQMGIKSATIISTKHPLGFTGAPYIREKNIDLSAITEKQMIFSGNALEAARAFPANVNVAATLSLAGLGPEKTQVQIWADPGAKSNRHEIMTHGEFSTIRSSVENTPDPANPKTSMLAAYSIISLLKGLSEPMVTLS
jgi:aspartate dehydrogenase